ncbi:MAG: TRAP transporter substrate-binding protein [Phreatobacter sp.]|jgi:TRAP-type C4-dicarboxylate transport system substrate-binding protein|uniref:TRAP transporter substrate-binding protein n=1 Tax=Phreatobacter sp. TaxID=1966341 RepID=UPI0040359148
MNMRKDIHMRGGLDRRQVILGLGATAAVIASPGILRAQAPVTLNGAVQFNDDHAFTKALVRFEERVKALYGKPVNFNLHKNSSLGLEKQYFEYMAQGRAVDYAIVSPAHMSTFARAAPFIDAPFVFRDVDHMGKVVKANVLKPIEDEVEKRAGVRLIGHAGGGTRNIFANKPFKNMAEMRGLKIRVQGAPIWSRTFAAAGMSPTVIAYNEVYNAIQNGVIQAGENEAAGVEAMKFYEVAPNLVLTQHAVSIRPICFSMKMLATLPKDLQDAIIAAGSEAGEYGRQVESGEDSAKLETLEKAGRLKRVTFEERDAMKKATDPVMAAYAKEIGAEAIFSSVSGV